MSLFSSGGGALAHRRCAPPISRNPIYNKVKTTNAVIKRYKEQVMTRTKKDETHIKTRQ